MTLPELCEPLFQAVCRLNRAGRKGVAADYAQVRGEIKAMLAEMRGKAATTPGLLEQFEKIEPALIFFIDSMISDSGLNFARDWHVERLAYELNPPERAGDDKFFDLLEQTLAETRASATERLQIFYTCLGLGFVGGRFGQPEYLRGKMNQVHARIRGAGDFDPASRICPEAYDNPNISDLIEPPGTRLVGIAIAMVGLTILGLIINFWLFKSAKSELENAVRDISRAAAQQAPPPAGSASADATGGANTPGGGT